MSVAGWREQLEESFPLLFFGASCFVMAVVAVTTNTHVGATRYPLWLLLLTLGVIAAAGGTASLFSTDEVDGFTAEELADGDLLVVPRAELEALRLDAAVRSGTRLVRSTWPERGRPSIASGKTRTGGPRLRRSPLPWQEADVDSEDLDAAAPHVLPPGTNVPVGPSDVTEDPTLREIDSLLAEVHGKQGRPPAGALVGAADGRPIPPPHATQLIPDEAEWLRRTDRSVPPVGADTEEAWFDRAQLPPEFSQLLSEFYPIVREGGRPASSARFPHPAHPASARCASCQGRLTSAVGECSACQAPLCRHCESVGRITSELPLCQSCAMKEAAGWPSSEGVPGSGYRP